VFQSLSDIEILEHVIKGSSKANGLLSLKDSFWVFVVFIRSGFLLGCNIQVVLVFE
jgi:hypothetical protein